ncbi:MAG: phenylacetic acid degradation protein PaaD [Hyphomicrobiales bacterium]|nr:MAG: phenylacetic acid degradation protein PaaD [Hyphomicrobiales bacterium]
MDARQIAEACQSLMWADDAMARELGMELTHGGPGEADIAMTITDAMTNPHGTAHGGYIFTLADTAFAYACNSYDNKVVASHCSITYIAPARVGVRLTASAREHVRFGRSGIYDVSVRDEAGELIAEFRGHSRNVKGRHLGEEPENDG